MLSPNLFAMCSVPRDVLDMTVALSLVLPAGLTAYALWVVAGRGVISTMQGWMKFNTIMLFDLMQMNSELCSL